MELAFFACWSEEIEIFLYLYLERTYNTPDICYQMEYFTFHKHCFNKHCKNGMRTLSSENEIVFVIMLSN